MFFLPGANAYRLKLLLPPGFEQTGGDYVDFIGDELSYPAHPVATYRIQGRFRSITEGTSFQLLRGHSQATDQSLFIEKARLHLKAVPGEPRASSSSNTIDDQTLMVIGEPEPAATTAGARAAAPSYRSSLEHARCETIGGWVIDANNPSQSVSLDIHLNGLKVATITADQPRNDVASAFGSSYNKYGFTWTLPASYKSNDKLIVSVRPTGSTTELTDSPRVTEICVGSGQSPITTPPSTTVTTPPSTTTATTPPSTTVTTPPTTTVTTPPSSTTATPPSTTVTTPPTTTVTTPPTTTVVIPPAPNASYRSSFEHARCETIGGWVFDASNPNRSVSLDVYINGTKVATIAADRVRSDVASAFGYSYNKFGFLWSIPDNYKSGARMTISVRPAGTSIELNSSPRTTDACAGSGTPPVTTEPPTTTVTTPPTTTVTTPPTTTVVTPPAPNASYRSSFEHARCETIGGWVFDASNPNRSVSLDVYINGTKVATIAADRVRSDVASAFGYSYNKFGFLWSIPDNYKSGARMTISVRPAGTSIELNSSPRTTDACAGSGTPPVTTEPPTTTVTTPPTTTVTTPPTTTVTTPPTTTVTTPPAPNASYRSSFEHARCETIGGWVLDANNPNQSVSLDVYINGTKVATIAADRVRSDVASAFGYSYNKYGFLWSIPDNYKSGARMTISVRPAGTSIELNSSPRTTDVCAGTGTPPVTTEPPTTTVTTPPTTTVTTPPTTTVTTPPTTTAVTPPAPNASYRSSLDHARCETVGGWILDANNPNQSVSLDIYINGTKAATITADQPRSDVASAFGYGYNKYGFLWTIPASYKSGAQLIVSVRPTGTDRNITNSPLTTDVCSGSGTPPVTSPPPSTTTTTPPVTTPPIVTPPPSTDYPILDSPQPSDLRPFIQNERVRVAIDLAVGGVVREVTDLQVGENMINCLVKDGKRDTGRDDQIAIYGLPDANQGWTTGGSQLHDNIGYNPVQGGDVLLNRSPILAFGKTNNMLYCKTRPLQWGLNNVPGDYIIEQWIQLQGNIVRRHVRITGNRPETGSQFYDHARQQELPCTYTSGSFYQYYVVQGTPYTNAPLVKVNDIPNLDGSGKTLNQYDDSMGQIAPLNVDASEPWIAAVRPQDNRGIALHTPFSNEFKVGLFNSVGWGPPEALNAGYIANGLKLTLDRNGVYEFDFNMVVGSLNEIRNTINSLPQSETKPHYVFAGQSKRHGFSYQKGYDQGYPVGDELSITPKNRRFSFTSPRKGYKASDINRIYIRIRARTNETQFVLKWRKIGQSPIESEWAGQSISFPITGDNQYRTIAIPVGNHPQWNGIINEFSINYANPNEEPANNQQIGIKWISAENLENQ